MQHEIYNLAIKKEFLKSMLKLPLHYLDQNKLSGREHLYLTFAEFFGQSFLKQTIGLLM